MAQNINQNINPVPNEPSLYDLLNYWKKQLKLEFNCHHIGTIQAFDPVTQTAQATINYSKTFLQIDSVGNDTVTTSNYPMLIDCPCVVLGGGGGYLSFPISSGDECLILFNDRDIDNWYSGSSQSAPATGRLHAFPDAVILVGLRSLANVIVGYENGAVTLQYSGHTVQIYPDKVLLNVSTNPEVEDVSLEINDAGKLKISNDTGEFVSALSQLFSDIQTATVNTIFGPQPLIMPTFVADLTIFNSFKE